jgi:hypothetical protein
MIMSAPKLSRDAVVYLVQVALVVAFLGALLYSLSMIMGCTPQQMRPVRQIVDTARDVADSTLICSDAIEQSAWAAVVVNDCMEVVDGYGEVEVLEDAESIISEPCLAEALAEVDRAVEMMRECTRALQYE